MYDILPGMDLSPTNPITLKQSNRSPFQVCVVIVCYLIIFI